MNNQGFKNLIKNAWMKIFVILFWVIFLILLIFAYVLPNVWESLLTNLFFRLLYFSTGPIFIILLLVSALVFKEQEAISNGMLLGALLFIINGFWLAFFIPAYGHPLLYSNILIPVIVILFLGFVFSNRLLKIQNKIALFGASIIAYLILFFAFGTFMDLPTTGITKLLFWFLYLFFGIIFSISIGAGLRELSKINIYTKYLIWVTIVAILAFSVFFLYQDKKTRKDWAEEMRAKRIISSMYQIRTEAELIYADEGSYINLSCAHDIISSLCERIKERLGFEPTIHTSSENYCIYIRLSEKEYYCIDNTGRIGKTKVNPDQVNYCDGKTFICPQQALTPVDKSKSPKKEEVSTTIGKIENNQREEQTNIEIYYLRVKGHKVEIDFGTSGRGPLPEGSYKIEVLDKDNKVAWEKEISTKELWYEREYYPYGKELVGFIEEFEKLPEKGYEPEFKKLLRKYLKENDICLEEVEEKYIDEFYKAIKDLSELYKKGKLKLKEIKKDYDYFKVKRELANIPYDPKMAVVRIYYEGNLVAEKYFPETIIIGRITDFSGKPLENARIDFCEESSGTSKICGTSLTDKDGDYTLDVFSDHITKLREGFYRLYISPPSSFQNLKTEFREINLKNKEVKMVDIALKQCGSIGGRIVDEEGNPMTEAWVYLVGYHTARFHVCEKNEDCRDRVIFLENEECKFYRKMLEFDICKDKKGCEKIQCREILTLFQEFYQILYEKKKCDNPLGTFIIPYLEPGDYKIGAFVKIGEKYIDLPPKETKVELGKTAIINFVFRD